MNRESSRKVLACAVCGKPTPAGTEAARVMCDACAAAGREFPRARQLELNLTTDFTDHTDGQNPPSAEPTAI